ncbi:hypothetical protein BD560DRAFT_423043 [Blakeslea trispora]|nr:hypothetical protein BD560DRAFT_423043 [Blakeslea trispora]
MNMVLCYLVQCWSLLHFFESFKLKYACPNSVLIAPPLHCLVDIVEYVKSASKSNLISKTIMFDLFLLQLLPVIHLISNFNLTYFTAEKELQLPLSVSTNKPRTNSDDAKKPNHYSMTAGISGLLNHLMNRINDIRANTDDNDDERQDVWHTIQLLRELQQTLIYYVILQSLNISVSQQNCYFFYLSLNERLVPSNDATLIAAGYWINYPPP